MSNWSEHASWKGANDTWRDDIPLCEQFFDNDCDLDDTDPSRSFIGIGTRGEPKEGDTDNKFETFVQMLSPKTWPSAMWFGNAIRYMGDFSGTDKTIKENYAVIGHVYFPNHLKQSTFFARKRQSTAKYAYGPLIKLQPKLGQAMNEFL